MSFAQRGKNPVVVRSGRQVRAARAHQDQQRKGERMALHQLAAAAAAVATAENLPNPK